MTKFLVIAASSCIGQALVSLLKESGHSVFTTARDDSKIRPDAFLDATDFEAMDEVFKQAGEIVGVVNCSGSLLLKSAHLTSRDQYQSVIDASLTTAFATVHAAGKYMNKGGSVVLISSAAATYASMNLRVNVVAPGLIETSLTKNLTGNETSRKFSEALHALGRLGKPEDIARAIVFLLDPDNSWITGQVLAVDGGLSSVLPKMRV